LYFFRPDIVSMILIVYIVLAVFTGLLLLGNLFTWVLQDLFIFRPQKLEATHRYQFDAPFREVSLIGKRKGLINSLWFKMPGETQSKGIVLYFHGNTGNLARWGNLHHFFFRFGYDFFVSDYRGFGKSRGPRNEHLMFEDAREVYRYVRNFYPPEKIVIFGRSLGSAFACRLAAEHPVRALILETPFASMCDLFYTYYPFLPRLFRFKYVLSNRCVLPKVRSPVFVFQGTDDVIVPLRCAARLKPALKPEDRFITIDMGRHNDLMIYEEYHRRMREILR
jgi:pimeloyl-ACP methyl ester carboxylesterase